MLALLGCNHRSAPVALRERLAFSDDDVPAALARLVARAGIVEGLLLSTCNRVEVLALTELGPQDSVAALRAFLCNERGVASEELDRHSFHATGREAVRHLFEVASGLDSMILGEPQILGQVKGAYRLARRAGTTGTLLEHLLQHSLACAKRVRSETSLSRNAVSVAFAAVELARRIFGRQLERCSALVLGAGKMSALVARHLASNGVRRLIVASRTFDHAASWAERGGGEAVHWDDGLRRLAQVDIVISATGATRPILEREHVAAALRARRGRPLFVIDIAVPRDVDPAVNELDNVYLYDIDGLQEVVDANLEERRAAAEDARRIVGVEVEAFDRWRQSLEVTPTIVALRERWLELGRLEHERFRRRLGPLSAEQERAVGELTRAIIQKILHRPTLSLRRSVERNESHRYVELYREVFDLTPGEPARGAGDAGSAQPSEGAGPSHVIEGGKES